MNATLEGLLNAVAQSLPGVEARIDEGTLPGSPLWLELRRAGRRVVVELREPASFALYLESSPRSAEVPTEIFTAPGPLLDRICRYLGPWPEAPSGTGVA